MNNLIIISIVSSALDFLAPIIIAFIVNLIHRKSHSNGSVGDELKSLKNEMEKISMVDEFSKYARLQRRYNKLQGEISKEVNDSAGVKAMHQKALLTGFRVIHGIVNAVLLWTYKGELIMDLPKGTLWPFEGIFSWPSNNSTGVSFLQWTILIKLGTSCFK